MPSNLLRAAAQAPRFKQPELGMSTYGKFQDFLDATQRDMGALGELKAESQFGDRWLTCAGPGNDPWC